MQGVQIGRSAGEHQLRLRCCSLKRSTEISLKSLLLLLQKHHQLLLHLSSVLLPSLYLLHFLSLSFLPVHTVLSPDDLRTRNRQREKSIPKVNGINKNTEHQGTLRKYANPKYGYKPNYAAVQRQGRPAPTILLPNG